MRSWIRLTACLAATALLIAPWAAAAAGDAGQLASAPAEQLTKPTPQPPLHHATALTETRVLNAEATRYQPAMPAQATAPSAAIGWTTIMTEDFEGAFPGAGWELWPTSPSEDHPTWGTSDYLPYGGTYSGYCVGSHINAPGPYPNNVDSWMVYGPFDTSSDCDLQMLLRMRYNTQPFLDELFIGASTDGSVFEGITRAGDSEGWLWERRDLSEFAGHSEVLIAFRFSSNDDVTDEGAYVDDVVLRKASAAPASPTLSQPAQGSCTTDSTPSFVWQEMDGATAYRLEVDNDPGFGSPEINKLTDWPGYTPASPLAAGAHYWRVRGENACGSSPWSSQWAFYVGAPSGAPDLLLPADDSHTCDSTPAFSWEAVSGAASYRLQVDDDSSFSSPEVNHTTSSTSHTPATPLAAGEYHWRVRAENGCGDGPWSSVRALTIDQAPSAPSLSAPGDTSHTCDTTPRFEWNAVSTAASYLIQVDNDPDFGSTEIKTTTADTYYQVTSSAPLSPDTYRWRVNASNDCGSGPWSAVWNLTIDSPPGAPSGPSPANHAIGAALNADLDWADAAGAMTYTVHFGKSSPPPFYGTAGTSDLALPQLDPVTLYYWQIEAHNDCGSTAGPVWDFTTGVNHAPALGTVDQSSGSGPLGITTYFTTTWTDGDGWEDLKQCYFHIGASPSIAGNVTLLYNAAKDKLWLRSDDGSAWTGGFAADSANTLENSQATVHCNLTTVQGAGQTLRVTWAIEFKPGYTGAKKLGLKCKDRNKARAKGAWKGTWTITSS
jgi:hypothetical protein